ncbi:S-layer homology domain-containing protein [Paenibacillus senegalensis]|uniref:S-layer homology domain-containing protein n=1 Tax=Paenibacillus senegalensis TaxID=1465766 RepID=UPI000289B391|nr:S-layer homology domain-containing protein [Paenibacillus senegalensis]
MKSGNKKEKKLLASLVASTLLLGAPIGGALPVFANSAPGAVKAAALNFQFPDVPSSHWAHSYVSKLALQGIIQGDDRGRYNPESQVNHQDAVILAIRLMGLEEEALAVKTDNTVLPFTVSNYARGYVITAIEHGLIVIREETSAGSGETSWGTRPASREWVAKLVIRALDKQSEADRKKNQSSGFADHGQISDSNVGFINEAVALKIVDGFEDNTFKPKQAVTRAQMATFISRAEPHSPVQSDKVTVGTISQVTSNSIEVIDKDGDIHNLRTTSDSIYYNASNNIISRSSLQPGYQIYTVVDGNTAYYIEVLEEASYQTLQGVLEEVDILEGTIILVHGGTTETLNLLNNVAITDKNGNGLSLSALVKGSQVEISRTTGANSQVVKIVVNEVPVNKSGIATFVSVDTEGKKLKFKEDGGDEQQFPYEENLSAKYRDGMRPLNQLFAGDTIRFKVENNRLVEVEVLTSVVESIEKGRMIDIKTDGRSRYVTVQKSDNQFGSYAYDNRVEVVMPWKDTSSIAELQIGDDLTLYLNQENLIQKIIVGERVESKVYNAEIMSYDKDNKYLIVKENNVPEIYTLNDRITFYTNGTSIPLESFATIFRAGTRVDLTFNNSGDLVSINMNSGYEGVISNINPTTRDLTLSMPDNQFLPLKLNTHVSVEKLNEDQFTVQDLKVGDKVKVVLAVNENLVYNIQVVQTLDYELVSRVESSRQLTVKDSNGRTVSYTVPQQAKLLNANGNAINWSQLTAGMKLKVTFHGKSVQTVQLVANN